VRSFCHAIIPVPHPFRGEGLPNTGKVATL
jgi:hypothetical protein